MGNEMNELRYLDLKNALCEKIYEGIYKDGKKIPSERQLSTDYEVSRITVRKTLELMEKENLIVREVGNGTRVTLKNYGNANPLDVVALTAPSRNPFFANFIAEFQKQAWEKNTLLLYVEVPERATLEDCLYRLYTRNIRNVVECANAASEAISILQVPFLSTLMDGIKTGVDTRDTKTQGTKYNGSGCLIHGLSVVADSFAAIDTLLAERPEDAERMVEALRDNFEHDPEMRQYLMKAKKYGNNIASVDKDAAEIAGKVSDMVCSKKNYLGNAFRADWASPSTHLLYGYWVGATPDGRLAREELGYGIDPLYGEAHQGLGFRIMSNMKLPFDKMNGGCASHLGINPNYFKSETMEGKGMEFKDKIMAPLFFNPKKTDGISPFYLYVNVTTPEMLRKVLANPKKYAPSGVYIMRIHGTFVNFLDLSPDIQEDIIKRLDMESTSM